MIGWITQEHTWNKASLQLINGSRGKKNDSTYTQKHEDDYMMDIGDIRLEWERNLVKI